VDPEADPAAGELADALISDALLSLGGLGVHLEDGVWTLWLPEATPLPEDPHVLAAELAARSGLVDISVEYGWHEDADWEELWKAGLDARRVTDRIVVTPSWIEVDRRPDDIVIVLDPGMAFGNAEHGTTRGCLRLLAGAVRAGDRLLDVGAGSAVLSIAGVLLGADHGLAVEADELAIETARENAVTNGVGDRVDVLHARVDADAIRALGRFDGVLCNIEGHYLEPLVPGLTAAVSASGWLVLSGILENQWPGFEADLRALGFDCHKRDADGEWRAGLFRRAAASGAGHGTA
jgi:ribosomal protein L11 methyltransferase